MAEPTVAIVDYGMGNLFSIRQACEQAGLRCQTTSDPAALRDSDSVILPGVGAFGEAMATLGQLGLLDVLKEVVKTGKPLIGICLGMQLLMAESFEFGNHRGFGLLEGKVVRFEPDELSKSPPKVPQIGWNTIHSLRSRGWEESPLEGLSEGEFMYFVHSFYVRPTDSSSVLATTRYGSTEFCSALLKENIFACQFHPERSGPQGIRIYQNINRWMRKVL